MKEDKLIERLGKIFLEREISFYDAFGEHGDAKKKVQIDLREFNRGVRSLNLNISVQEGRTLIRMADPNSTGKIDVERFCKIFEAPAMFQEMRTRRLKKVLRRVATAFYLQNFNLRQAFLIFD